MIQELCSVDTLVNVKYNKALKTLLLRLYKLYLPLDSHLKLYILYKLAAVL